MMTAELTATGREMQTKYMGICIHQNLSQHLKPCLKPQNYSNYYNHN